MMMKKSIIIALLGLVIMGCSDFLQEEPYDFLSTTNFYKSEKDALAAVNAVYDILGSQGSVGIYWETHYLMMDLTTEESRLSTRTSQRKVEMDDLVWDATNIQASRLWNSSYIGINRANAAIARIPHIEMNEELKTRLLGEVKFIRALLYFNLVRAYGDVPIREEESTDLNVEWTREPKEQVYELIISDLKEAKTALPVSYDAVNVGRATRGAASGLLGKVYVTMAGNPLNDTSKWALAVEELRELVNAGNYALFEDYADVFSDQSENGVEHMFSVQFKKGGFFEGSLYNTFWSPRGNGGLTPLSGLEDVMAETEFYNTFNDSDIRKSVTFLTEYTNPATGETVSFPSSDLTSPACWKYFDPDGSGWRDNDNNWMVLRYSDVLLLYAEALNELNSGPDQEAYNAINQVRQRAGMPNLENMDVNSFREAVYQERSWELCYEGHRWYDLARQGRFVEVMQESGKEALPKHTLFPLPLDQLVINPVKQNPGY